MIFLYYVQEIDKPNLLYQIFNIVRLKNDKIILPINKEKISDKKAKKLVKKIKKILEQTKCKKIILSKKLKKYENLKNEIYSNNLEIINGRWLFGVLGTRVIKYIIKKKKMKSEEIQISILINDISEIMLENIKQIVREYKKVNIVTNHIEKFKKIEEQILKEEGIMITVSRNKRKSLLKSQIILNVDFPSELINQYRINEEAIIVNLRGNVEIKSKRFNGINVNDYEIDYQIWNEFDYEKDKLYYKKDCYEAEFYQKQPFEYINRKIDRDKVKITKLIAERSEF